MKFSAKPAEGGKSCLCFSASSKSRYIIRQIMRLSLITAILITTTFQIMFAAETMGQAAAQVEVTMELKNEPFLSAIKKIEQQTNFRFVYRNSDVAVPGAGENRACPQRERSKSQSRGRA